MSGRKTRLILLLPKISSRSICRGVAPQVFGHKGKGKDRILI